MEERVAPVTDLYLGRWTLVPELCLYDEGVPPEHATYEMQRDGSVLRVRICWRPTGQPTDVTAEYTGPETGEVQPTTDIPGISGLSITRVDERTLDSAAWSGTAIVSSARRVASADGELLAVRQSTVREDGGVLQTFQVCRRTHD